MSSCYVFYTAILMKHSPWYIEVKEDINKRKRHKKHNWKINFHILKRMSALDYNTFVMKHSPLYIRLTEDINKRKGHKKHNWEVYFQHLKKECNVFTLLQHFHYETLSFISK